MKNKTYKTTFLYSTNYNKMPFLLTEDKIKLKDSNEENFEKVKAECIKSIKKLLKKKSKW